MKKKTKKNKATSAWGNCFDKKNVICKQSFYTVGCTSVKGSGIPDRQEESVNGNS